MIIFHIRHAFWLHDTMHGNPACAQKSLSSGNYMKNNPARLNVVELQSFFLFQEHALNMFSKQF
jgi:hypothetical protein